jgi:predicted NAD/FAD-binding protein
MFKEKAKGMVTIEIQKMVNMGVEPRTLALLAPTELIDRYFLRWKHLLSHPLYGPQSYYKQRASDSRYLFLTTLSSIDPS